MRQLKIRIKSAAGSLAWRAVVVSLCLLVLPLFLNTLYLYRADYFTNVDHARATLKQMVEAQNELMSQKITWEWNVLDAVKKGGEASEVKVISTPQGVDEAFVIIDKEGETFLVGVQADLTHSFVIETPLRELFQMLTRFQIDTFPTSLAFIGKNGEVLAGVKQETPFYVEEPIAQTSMSLYLSISTEVVSQLSKTSYFFHFLFLFFFIAIVGGAIVAIITRRIARPFNMLCDTMRRVSEGAFHARYVPDRMGFEINVLGQQFNETLDQLLFTQEEAEKERIGRERLAQELKIGHEIQVNLLPTHLPQFKGLDVFAGFVPSREVGGDFYDLFSIHGGKLLIAIADTAGKGVSACLYSLGLRSMLRALASTGKSLSEIVLEANRLFWQDARDSSMFVTLWIGLYHPEKNELEYCSLGHPAALLVEGDTARELSTFGIPIGIQPLEEIKTETLIFPPKSLLFLYTDGITESYNKEDEFFGLPRLKKMIQENAQFPVQEIGQRILDDVARFSEGVIQHDDLTFIVLKNHLFEQVT